MSRLLLSLCVLCCSAQLTVAADQPDFDWSAWKRIPVLDDGRIKPLDTFAEEKVTLISGRAKWTDPNPDNKRTYKAPELLYNWLTAPEVWLAKPVIRCEFRPLRELLLGADQKEGTYIAVSDFIDWKATREAGKFVFHKAEVQEKFEKLEAMQGRRPAKGPTDETPAEKQLRDKVTELINHTMAFLTLSSGKNLFVIPGIDPRTLTRQFDPDVKLHPWIALETILEPATWKENRDVTIAVLTTTDRMELANEFMTREMYRREEVGHLPQLFQAVQFQGELGPKIAAVRPVFEQTRKDYDAKSADFSRSMRIFVDKLDDLAHAMENVRHKMGPLEEADAPKWYKPLELDERQLASTAYPAIGALDTEILYNRVQPFYMACWFFGLAALPLLASWIFSGMSGFQGLARSTYLLGLAVTAGAILFATWGFALRVIIAGRPPVTNMYETVIWVSYVASVLGFWFGMLPLVWPGMEWGWRLSAIPFSWEDGALTPTDERKLFARAKTPIGTLATVVRAAGFVSIVYFLTQSDSSFRIISLMPPITAVGTFSPNAVLTWLVGIVTVLTAAWVLPRVAVALAFGTLLIIPEARRTGPVLWEQTFSRRLFLVTSIPVALFGLLLAYNVGNISPEILNPRIGSIAAVLRNNYWLTIHVLTIVSSYGAGALVWGLGNLAMLYYLFGSYRREETSFADVSGESGTLAGEAKDTILTRLRTAGRGLAPAQIGKTFAAGFQGLGSGDDHLEHARVRPPKDVLQLASFGYKGMQVAVLLLAAGTILGGLWADVSWGRFWDWDPKEVWALISLLVYLVFLHGRYAGWVGTFGTNAGSVLCFQAIMMSWYGVNFVLPMVHGWWNGTNMPTSVGLHSYATGAGGLEYVVGLCALNLLLVFMAWARYTMETMQLGGSQPSVVVDAAPAKEEAANVS